MFSAFLETGSHSIAQAILGLQLIAISLPSTEMIKISHHTNPVLKISCHTNPVWRGFVLVFGKKDRQHKQENI